MYYVLARVDRYSHDLGDDTDDTDDSPVIGLFSSCSPQYRRVHSTRLGSKTDQEVGIDSLRITTSAATTPEALEPEFRSRYDAAFDKDSSDMSLPDFKKVIIS